MNKAIRLGILGILVSTLGCSGDLNRDTAPVNLVITTTSQPIQRFDLAGGTGCSAGATIVNMSIRSNVKSSTIVNTTFLDVRVKSYHVSYTRTDGGHTIPAPYDRTADFIVGA